MTIAVALAFASSACGDGVSKMLAAPGPGGAAGSASGGAAGTSAGAGGVGGGSESFITADVDGVTLRAVVEAWAVWFPGLVQGYLSLYATTTDREWTWTLSVVNKTGPQPCSTASVQLLHNLPPNEFYGNFMTTGGCSFTISSAAPDVGDVLEGTFEAPQLDPLPTNHATRVVTAGAFHLVRATDEALPP